MSDVEEDDVSSTSASRVSVSRYRDKIDGLKEDLRCVKKLRPYHITHAQKCDIIYAHRSLELAGAKANAKSPNKRPKGVYAQAKVVEMLGYSSTTVASVMAEWKRSKQVAESAGPGNRTAKAKRVPELRCIVTGVRKFVRDRRRNRQRTVAKDVLEYLIDQGLLVVGEGSHAKKVALRAVQRFLQRQGYRRGSRPGSMGIQEKASLVEARRKYVCALRANRLSGPDVRLREVYLDESYVNHHYRRDDESMYDPNDELDLVPRSAHKGNRYCFCAAIQGPNYCVRESRTGPYADDSDEAGVVPNSVWVFQGGNPLKDYHKTFNGVTFFNWFVNNVLENLTEPSLIIMDNASYHKSPHPDAKRFKKMTKDELRRFLTEKNIEFESNAPKAVLIDLCQQRFPDESRAGTEVEAEKRGHKILFTPPYHSELQPIELVWAYVKGYVGRKYHHNISFADVLDNLNEAFVEIKLKRDTIRRYIDHAYVVGQKYIDAPHTRTPQHHREDDTSDSYAEGSESDNSSDSSDDVSESSDHFDSDNLSDSSGN